MIMTCRISIQQHRFLVSNHDKKIRLTLSIWLLSSIIFVGTKIAGIIFDRRHQETMILRPQGLRLIINDPTDLTIVPRCVTTSKPYTGENQHA